MEIVKYDVIKDVFIWLECKCLVYVKVLCV